MLKKILLASALLAAHLAGAALEVNQATVAELDGIKGIGPSLSRQILVQRDQGPFKDWTDFLIRVPGVKDKTAARFSAQGLTVDGTTYPAAPAKPWSEAATTREMEKSPPAP